MEARSLCLAGDIMLQSRLASLPQRNDPQFEQLREELSESVMALANLEGPLSYRGAPVPKYANLRADPAIATDLRALGFGGVTMANNHMMDYGPLALADTLAVCDAAGLLHCGAGSDLDAALAPAWFNVGDQQVGLLSVACTLPIESEARQDKPGVAPLHIDCSFEIDMSLQAEQPGTMPTVRSWARAHDQDRLCRLIATTKEQVAMVIVAIHWGVPPHWLSPSQGLLATYQRPLAHALIDAGADVVWGHHAHVMHPIEIYRGHPIFYSLGNFFCEIPEQFMEFMQPEALLARLAPLHRELVELVPILVDGHGVPRRARSEDALRVLQKARELSAPYGAQVAIQDDQGYLQLT